MRPFAYLPLLLICASAQCFGQGIGEFPIQFFNDEIAPTRFWRENMLPSTNVNCALWDGSFIWVGSSRGLSRFDGSHFVNFVERKELPINWVRSINQIVKSKNGDLWLCHSKGISRFNPYALEEKFYDPIEPNSLGRDSVAAYNLIETTGGEVYATTYWGLAKYDASCDEFNVLPVDTVQFKGPPFHITKQGPLMEDLNLGGIWFSTLRYLCFYDYASKTFFSSKNNPKKWAIFDKQIEHKEAFKMMKDKTGNCWFSVRREPFLFKFDPNKNKFERFPIHEPTDPKKRIIEPAANELFQLNETEIVYCPESGGIMVFDTRTHKFRRVYYQLESVHRVPFMPIVSEMKALNNQWVSIATNNGWYVQRIFNFIDDVVPFDKPLAIGAYSQLYMGAGDRLYIRSNNHELQFYDLTSKAFTKLDLMADTTAFDEFYYIYPTINKCFFTNTNSGIVKVDTRTNKFKRWKLSNFNLEPSHRIYGAFKDSLYFISKRNSDSILIVDNKGRMTGSAPFPNSPTDEQLYYIFMDSKHRIWASYEQHRGYWLQKKRGEEPVQFQKKGKFDTLFKYMNYGRSFEDKKGQIWVVTSGAGALVISPELDSVYHYSTKDGLKSNGVWMIDFLDSNMVLLASKSNFLLYDLKLGTPTRGDYRRFFDANPMYSYPLRVNGKIFMASYENLFTCDLAKMSVATVPDSPFVAAIISNKKLYSLEELKNGLVLSQDETDLEFHFADKFGFDFAGNQNWHYRIKGVKDDWVRAVERKVNINNLRYGNYVLELQTNDPFPGKGRPNDVLMQSLPITILPYWYQTHWFKTLATLAAAALIWWLFRQNTLRQLAAQRAEIEKQQALERERERIARDMHDDLGSGLSAIHLLSNLAKQKATDHAIQNEIEKIAASSANLNQNIREIIWTVNAADDTLASLSNFLRRYCVDFQENTGLRVVFETTEPLPETVLNGEVRRNLFLCVKEALNNASKHGQAKNILVKLGLEDRQLTVTVNDDGTGFDQAAALRNGGNGLKNIQQRMEKLGGNAVVATNSNGTKWLFELTV